MDAEKVSEYCDQPVWLYAGSLKATLSVACPLGPHFTSGFFLFDSTWATGDLRALIVTMLNRGCVSMMFHGARCKEAHDFADEVFINDGFEANFGGREDTLMTTGLEGEDAEGAVFNLFCASSPTSGFVNSGYYVFSFGSAAENTNLRLMLSDPGKAIRAAVDREIP